MIYLEFFQLAYFRSCHKPRNSLWAALWKAAHRLFHSIGVEHHANADTSDVAGANTVPIIVIDPGRGTISDHGVSRGNAVMHFMKAQSARAL